MIYNSTLLGNQYKIMKLKDCIVRINTGLNPRNNFALGNGDIKYITAKNLTRAGYIDFSTCDYIDSKAKKIIRKRSGLQIGNILFSSRAPIGQCHLIKEEPDYYDIGESIFCIEVDENIILPEYLCLYLTSDLFIHLASKNVSGSVIKEIRLSTLLDMDIVIPQIEIQEKIAGIINAIDEKLLLNKSICFDLKTLAKEIYDYWFVQFDFPDENGKPYKSSGGRMVWSKELNWKIPEGWEITTLKDKYRIERGISYTSKDIESGKGIAMINLACIDRSRNYRDGELKYYDGKITDKDYVHHNDLLIACTDLTRKREIIGCPILVPNDSVNYTYSMDIAKISFCDDLDDLYMYMTLRTNHYHKYIKEWASGTNVLHLNLEGLDWYPICVPPKHLQERMAKIVEYAHNQISVKLSENRQLTELRDFLLPMLMNGQIKIDP